MNDRGIWAIWYDYEADRADEYLAWLHESYLPQMLEQPGYIWAAHIRLVNSAERRNFVEHRYLHTEDPLIGKGNEFLLIFGGESAHTFLNPHPREVLEPRDGDTRRMLSGRSGLRYNILTEVDRVDGPAIASRGPGPTPGPIIQMGTYTSHSVDDEADLCNWYIRHRLPLVQHDPYCVGARRLVSVVGWAKQSILYEFTHVDNPDGHFSDPNKESQHVITTITHAPHSPVLGHRIWPPVR